MALLALCSACQQPWPEPGRGGMVEARWPAAVADEHAPASLHDRLHCTLGRFDALRAAAEHTGQHTGEIALLDITATRAKREYAGHLFDDSRVTLDDLDTGIDHLRREMVPTPASLPVCS
jgi:hypothetical protein